MDQQIINLYDEYTHKPLTRQEFLHKLAILTGSTAAAMTVLPLLESCASVHKTSSDELFTERISYTGSNGTMNAYMARPGKEKKYPAVMVIHENRGLNPHIEDIARRTAQAGYLAIAPDALSPQGGTPADMDKARELFSKLEAQQNLQNFIKGLDYVKSRRDCNGALGCVGFCWGGAMANNLAVTVPGLKAAIAFYGTQPKAAQVSAIKAAIQLHYGALDERVNAGIPDYEEALKKEGKTYELYIYPGVNHAFHNDTSPARYNEAAAKVAWQRSMDFFSRYLQ